MLNGSDEYIAGLIRRMDAARVSRNRLAEEAEMDRAQLARLLNRRVENPRLDTVQRVERALAAIIEQEQEARRRRKRRQ